MKPLSTRREVIAGLISLSSLLTACEPEPTALTISVVPINELSFESDVESYLFRAEYIDATTDRLRTFTTYQFSASSVAGLAPIEVPLTQPGEELRISLEAYRGADRILDVTSPRFVFDGSTPVSLKLLLAPAQTLVTLSQTLERARYGHALVSLGAGRFLVGGGADGLQGDATSSLEWVDDGSTSLHFGLEKATTALTRARVFPVSGRLGSLLDPTESVPAMIAGGDSFPRLSLSWVKGVAQADGLTASYLVPEFGVSLQAIQTYDSVDLFDPVSGTVRTLKPLVFPVSNARAVSLESGHLFYCGGLEKNGTGQNLQLSANCFECWADFGGGCGGVAGGSPVVLHQLTQLSGDYVLSSGGMTGTSLLARDEQGVLRPQLTNEARLYAFQAGYVQASNALMKEARAGHSTVALPTAQGEALLTGGFGQVVQDRQNYLVLLDSAEIFNRYSVREGQETRAFRRLDGRLNHARALHTSVALEDGRILIVGGFGADPSEPLPAEIFDPAQESQGFVEVPELVLPAMVGLEATVLDSGQVLLTGGVPVEADASAVAAVRIYTP